MFETFDDFLTIEEVAEILKIGSTQTYKMVRSGELKAFKVGKSWKIPRVSLEILTRQKLELPLHNM